MMLSGGKEPVGWWLWCLMNASQMQRGRGWPRSQRLSLGALTLGREVGVAQTWGVWCWCILSCGNTSRVKSLVLTILKKENFRLTGENNMKRYCPFQEVELFLSFFFSNGDHFKSLYWIYYDIASVLCFGFLTPRHMGSNPHPLHWKVKS